MGGLKGYSLGRMIWRLKRPPCGGGLDRWLVLWLRGRRCQSQLPHLVDGIVGSFHDYVPCVDVFVFGDDLAAWRWIAGNIAKLLRGVSTKLCVFTQMHHSPYLHDPLVGRHVVVVWDEWKDGSRCNDEFFSILFAWATPASEWAICARAVERPV